jgi:hypothetical protein
MVIGLGLLTEHSQSRSKANSIASPGGTAVEDGVEKGLVLFITDEPVEEPFQVDLYDRVGALVGQHPAF